MRFAAFLLLQLLLFTSVQAQKNEFSVHLNSGLFSFGGESATATTFMVDPTAASGDEYTNNPYGSNNAFSYGLAVQAQRKTSGDVLFGIQGGYEVLRSSVNITSVENASISFANASGNTHLIHSFINLHPKVGYRFTLEQFDFDITAGPEIGFMLDSEEKGEADLEGGSTISTENERLEMGNDYRLRSQATIHYNQWGLSVGYSYGLRNYRGNTLGANRKSYARFIRFGVSYYPFR